MNGSLKNHSTRRVGVKRALSDSESTMYLNRFESKGRTARRLVDDNTLYRLVKEGLENLVRTRRTVSVSELRTYVLGVDSGAFVALLNTVKITARSDCGRWKTRRFRGARNLGTAQLGYSGQRLFRADKADVCKVCGVDQSIFKSYNYLIRT